MELEISYSFNIYQIDKLIKYIKLIKIDNKKFKDHKYYEYLMKKINEILIILENSKQNRNITYENLVKLQKLSYNYLINNQIINPFIICLINLYLYHFIVDVDYINEKKLNPDINFNNISYEYYLSYSPKRTEQFLIKNYLPSYIINPYNPSEKDSILKEEKRIQSIDESSYLLNRFLHLIGKDRNIGEPSVNDRRDINLIPLFFSNFLNFFRKHNELDRRLPENNIIINNYNNEEIIEKLKVIFDKKVKKEMFETAIRNLLLNQHTNLTELYENVEKYLETENSKDNLIELFKKIKHNKSLLSIKDNFLKCIEILTDVIRRINRDTSVNNFNLINILKTLFEVRLTTEEILIDSNLNDITVFLMLFMEIKNSTELQTYFTYRSRNPIDNIDFIINSFEELIDLIIEYIDNEYQSLSNGPEYVIGGCKKKIIRKY